MPDPAVQSTGNPAPLPGTLIGTLKGLAGYRCGHTGSCCRAGWPIPVEPAPLEVLRQALASGRLHSTAPRPIEEGRILGRTAEGSCGFLRHDGLPGGCEVERRVGLTALGASCRQFPRIMLVDARGWHQTLSAWCGTAARLIASPLEHGSFLSFDHIQADPRVHVEALDAREAWPPLLRPGVLAGHDGYALWESLVFQRYLARVGSVSAGAALRALVIDTAELRDWRPGRRDLPSRVRDAMQGPGQRPPIAGAAAPDAAPSHLLHDLIKLVPDEWRPPRWPSGVTDASETPDSAITRAEADRIVARYLGTRLVGSWVAYQGQGLLSVACSLVAAYALVVAAMEQIVSPPTIGRMTNALRASDWLILHLLDRQAWANWCSRAEKPSGAARLLEHIAAADAAWEALPWTSPSTRSPSAHVGR